MLTSLTLARAMANSSGRLPPPPRRQHGEQPIPAESVSAAHLSTYLKNKPFLPDVSYAALLADISSTQKNLQQHRLNTQLQQYNALYWVQKLFCEKPTLESAHIREVPFPTLEHRYSGQAGPFELFNALCELREHRLITLDTHHPYQVGITRKGRKVLHILQQEAAPPPPYQDAEDTFLSTATSNR